MNNEQNNSIFGIPSQTPSTPETKPAPEEAVVPKINASLAPSGTPLTALQPENSTTSESTIPVQPIPSVAESNPTNSSAEATNNTIFADNSSITTEPATQISENQPQELKIDTPSPFDIGIGSANDTINTGVPTPIITPDNTINTPTETPAPINNIVPPANNSSDAAPLTSANNNSGGNDDNVVSVKKYLIHMLLCCIPVAGIIILFIRAFGNKENKSISNLAKAQLIISAAAVVLSVVFMIIGGIAMTSIANTIEKNTNNYNSSYDYDY